MKLKYVSTGVLAKKDFVSTQTIRRWIKDGKYEHTYKTKGGDFRIGIPYEERTIHYARVSSKKQNSSINRQLKELKYSTLGKFEEISDVGSGFNFKRKGFKTILERAIKGEILNIVVTDKDRFTRVGFDFIEWIVEHAGGSIKVINNTPKSEKFDYENLISFITVFCNSYYGKGSNRNKKNKNLS